MNILSPEEIKKIVLKRFPSRQKAIREVGLDETLIDVAKAQLAKCEAHRDKEVCPMCGGQHILYRKQKGIDCPTCNGTGKAHRDSPDSEKALREFTSILSFKLGGFIAEGLFENYPDGFNKLLPKLAKELFDQISALFPDIEQIRKQVECAYEDWDDTTLPNPVCHCLKRDGVDCANVPDDVEACPDFMSKKDYDIEQAKREERERILKDLLFLDGWATSEQAIKSVIKALKGEK